MNFTYQWDGTDWRIQFDSGKSRSATTEEAQLINELGRASSAINQLRAALRREAEGYTVHGAQPPQHLTELLVEYHSEVKP